jgi:hypothetical protein
MWTEEVIEIRLEERNYLRHNLEELVLVIVIADSDVVNLIMFAESFITQKWY